MLSSVDLPEPDAPMMATNSPRPIESETSSSARTSDVADREDAGDTVVELDQRIAGVAHSLRPSRRGVILAHPHAALELDAIETGDHLLALVEAAHDLGVVPVAEPDRRSRARRARPSSTTST